MEYVSRQLGLLERTWPAPAMKNATIPVAQRSRELELRTALTLRAKLAVVREALELAGKPYPEAYLGPGAWPAHKDCDGRAQGGNAAARGWASR